MKQQHIYPGLLDLHLYLGEEDLETWKLDIEIELQIFQLIRYFIFYSILSLNRPPSSLRPNVNNIVYL